MSYHANSTLEINVINPLFGPWTLLEGVRGHQILQWWTLCLTAGFLDLGYSVDPIAGQQPHISIYKVRRCAVSKLITLISKVLMDDGNRILNPQVIF